MRIFFSFFLTFTFCFLFAVNVSSTVNVFSFNLLFITIPILNELFSAFISIYLVLGVTHMTIEYFGAFILIIKFFLKKRTKYYADKMNYILPANEINTCYFQAKNILTRFLLLKLSILKNFWHPLMDCSSMNS